MIFALAMLLTACTGIAGSGTEREESRSVQPFSRIEVSGAASLDVTVRPGTVPTAVVRTDDNLQQYVKLVNDGATLRIVTEGNLRPSRSVHVKIQTDSLTGLGVSGAVNVKIVGLHGASFQADLGGAGDVELAGEVAEFQLDTSGAASVKAAGLKAKVVRVQLSGAGHAEAFASDEAVVDVSGAGDVELLGKPAKVEKKVSGVGRVSVR